MWTLVLAIGLNSAQAATVLVQGPQSQDLDYRSALRANGDYISPTRQYLEVHPSLAARESLLAVFAAAQKSFLEASNLESHKKFEQVVELLGSEDWARSDREIFLQCYLRLAQLEPAPKAKDRWLELSLLLGLDLNYDKSLYPPPLLARRQELARQLRQIKITRDGLNPGWTEILINGEPCNRLDCGNWPHVAGLVRVTVLSDRWIPQTRMMSTSDLAKFAPPAIEWATGNCESSEWNTKAARFLSKKIFWSPECEQRKAALNLKPVPTSTESIPMVTMPTHKTTLLESKWLWAGVVTAIAVILVRGSQSHESKQTTTTYGY